MGMAAFKLDIFVMHRDLSKVDFPICVLWYCFRTISRFKVSNALAQVYVATGARGARAVG